MRVLKMYLPWYADEEEIQSLEQQGIEVELVAAWPDELVDVGREEALLLAAGAACCCAEI